MYGKRVVCVHLASPAPLIRPSLRLYVFMMVRHVTITSSRHLRYQNPSGRVLQVQIPRLCSQICLDAGSWSVHVSGSSGFS